LLNRERDGIISPMRWFAATLLALLLLLSGTASASEAGKTLQRLERRTFQGRSISDAGSSDPIRSPATLEVYFRRVEISGYGDATPTLYWKSTCNGHDYILAFVHKRLHTSAQTSTKTPCTGYRKREERWLENFFSEDLALSLAHGRLTLTTGQRRMVLVGKWLLGSND
jgi:heat shock protein HslJ